MVVEKPWKADVAQVGEWRQLPDGRQMRAEPDGWQTFRNPDGTTAQFKPAPIMPEQVEPTKAPPLVEAAGNVVRGAVQGFQGALAPVGKALGASDKTIDYQRSRTQQNLDAAIPAPTTVPGQVLEGITKGTVQAIPALAAMAPLRIPGVVGETTTKALTRVGIPAGVAAPIGGGAAVGAGAAEFGVAEALPDALRSGDASKVAKGAAAPFISLAKLAPGGAEPGLEDYINAAFFAFGGIKGRADLARVRQQARDMAARVARGNPELAVKVRNEAAARGDAASKEIVQAFDDVMGLKTEPAPTGGVPGSSKLNIPEKPSGVQPRQPVREAATPEPPQGTDVALASGQGKPVVEQPPVRQPGAASAVAPAGSDLGGGPTVLPMRQEVPEGPTGGRPVLLTDADAGVGNQKSETVKTTNPEPIPGAQQPLPKPPQGYVEDVPIISRGDPAFGGKVVQPKEPSRETQTPQQSPQADVDLVSRDGSSQAIATSFIEKMKAEGVGAAAAYRRYKTAWMGRRGTQLPVSPGDFARIYERTQTSSAPAAAPSPPAASAVSPAVEPTATPPAAAPVGNKQPWEMTKAEWDQQINYHGAGESASFDVEQSGSIDRGDITKHAEKAARYTIGWGDDTDGGGAIFAVEGRPPTPHGTVQAGEKLRVVAKLPRGAWKDPHRHIIETAVAEGRYVPPHVLADYPHLKPVSRLESPDASVGASPSTQSSELQTADSSSPANVARRSGGKPELPERPTGRQVKSSSEAIVAGPANAQTPPRPVEAQPAGVKPTAKEPLIVGDTVTVTGFGTGKVSKVGDKITVTMDDGRKRVVSPNVVKKAGDAPKLASAPLPPPPGQPSSGRQGGATPIPREVAAEILGTAKGVGEQIVEGTQAAGRVLSHIFRRGTNWMETLGNSGKRMAKEIRDIDFRVGKAEANALEDLKVVMKGLNRSQRELVAKAVNDRPSAKDAPESVKARANEVRKILDKYLLEEAKKLGFKRQMASGEKLDLKGSGKAFPQVPNKEGIRVLKEADDLGLASPRVMRAAEKMVNSGDAQTLDDALAKLRDFRAQQKRGVNPYLERTRTELPEDLVEWDPAKVLPNVIHRGLMTIEGVREWGMQFPRQKATLERIQLETDAATAEQIDLFLQHHFGMGGKVMKAHEELAGMLSNYEVMTKLGFSPLSALRNLGQPIINSINYPLPVVLKSYFKMPPIVWRFFHGARKLREQIMRSGAVRASSSLANIEKHVPGEKATRMAMGMFQAAETSNHVRAALIARMGLENDLLTLAKIQGEGRAATLLRNILSLGNMSEGAIIRRLEKVSGLSAKQIGEWIDSGKRLTPDELDRVMTKFVLDTQFPVTLATERVWWPLKPWARLWAKFKIPFGADQIGFFFKNAMSEAVRGNFRPLAMFALAGVFLGEVYNLVRDNLVGDEKSTITRLAKRPDTRNVKDVSISLLRNMKDGAGLGLLTDLMYGVSNWIGGPVGGSLENLFEAGAHVSQDPSQWTTALRDFVGKEVAVNRQVDGVVNRMERAAGKDNNRHELYRTWRNRAFEHLGEKEDAGDFFADVFTGRGDHKITDRTLSYDYAARQITVGDVDDAADYLKHVLDNAEDKEEVLKGIRLSMKSKSPLGKIAEKDRSKFLLKFTPEQRVEARKLQIQWLADYEQAINKARLKK